MTEAPTWVAILGFLGATYLCLCLCAAVAFLLKMIRHVGEK